MQYMLAFQCCFFNLVIQVWYHTFFYMIREHDMGNKTVHINSSLNGIDRTSYEFLLKYRTKVKIAVKTNHKDQVIQIAFKEKGVCVIFLWLFRFFSGQ